MKIDIQVKDNRKYALIAFLVDREDFLNDIADVRKQIKLSKLPYVFPKYVYEEANKFVDYYEKGQITFNDISNLLQDVCTKKGLLNLYALDKTLGAALIFAKSLTKKYDKNKLYTPFIFTAILTGQVKEEDFFSTQMLTLNRKTLDERLRTLDKDEEIVIISVNRESTKGEVLRTLDFIQKYYFKTKRIKSEDRLRNKIYENIPDTKVPDTANNIKRDRDWYWLKKEGWSYRDIKNNYKEKKYPIVPRGIELAIKRYSENLK